MLDGADRGVLDVVAENVACARVDVRGGPEQPGEDVGAVDRVLQEGAASRVGAAVTPPIVVLLMVRFGWRAPFLLFGFLGLGWSAIWYWYYRDPMQHSKANDAECEYIAAGGGRLDETDDADAVSVRWIDLFRYRTVQGMMLGFFCLNFVIYFFLTWFPTYLKDARGFDLLQLGTLCEVLYGRARFLILYVCSGVMGR